MFRTISLCALPWLLLVARPAAAQGEYNNWYSGQRAGLAISAGTSAVQPLTNSAMTTPAACATLSDAAGNLLIYSNGEQVWDARHQSLPGGPLVGVNIFFYFAQSCALLRCPHSARNVAYLFTKGRAGPNSLTPIGCPVVAEVELATASNNSRIRQLNLSLVADSVLQRLGEQEFALFQAMVRHANGRDVWLLNRLHAQGIFLASLVDGSGTWPCARTVVSRVLPVRTPSSAI